MSAEKVEETKLSWDRGKNHFKSSSPAGFSPAVPFALISFSVVRGERKANERTNIFQLN